MRLYRSTLSLFIAAFGLNLGVSVANAEQARDASDAQTRCSGAFRCDGETIAPDNRASLPIQQPSNPSAVQGACTSSRQYMARPLNLTCGGADPEIHRRERMAHSQDDLDRNFELLQLGRAFTNRDAAQKVLLKPQQWSHAMKIAVTENWSYKQRVGGYVNCSGRFQAEGGEVENYETTCYRKGREEKVVRRVITKQRYCTRPNPPPPPPPPREEPSGGGGSSTFTAPAPRRDSPPPNRPAPTIRTGPTDRRDSEDAIKDRMRRGFNSSNDDVLESFANRAPAWGLRRIDDRVAWASDDNPTYGCAVSMSERVVSQVDEEIWVDAPDLQYTCTKTRNQWCTWFEDQSFSQACPQEKTVTVNVKYVTPSDWNANHPKYDDMLPNKFDLLIGESELVRVALNNARGVRQSGMTSITPMIQIANGNLTERNLPRPQPWNNYTTKWTPEVAACRYADQAMMVEVTPVDRIVQSAPNPLQIARDEAGNPQPFEGTDDRGRPASLRLTNPTRQQVLDRSNLSRIFGEDASAGAAGSRVRVSTDPALQNAGISRKFWENTRFWMRMVWMDGDTKVKVTLGRPFNINTAGAIGDTLNISLTGSGGMRRFYQLAVPFENFFGFLGGDVPLDPSKRYFIEIKVAQPGFDGIYLSGLANDPTLSDEERRLINNDAYSESQLIPLAEGASSSRTLMQRFWDWRARRMSRP